MRLYLQYNEARGQYKKAVQEGFSQMFQVFFANEIVRDFWFNFVKIILLKSDNCALTLRKRLFCDAKPTLLPCKTAAFGTQNNRFYNVLMIR